VFWDAEGILFIDYLENGRITGEYYSNLLTRLETKRFVRKGPVCKRKKSSFIRTLHPPTKIKGSALRIVGTSTLFPRFDSL
jgi:hypothetical protein